MSITHACAQILDQLATLVNVLTNEQYAQPSQALSRSTIGQHLRHTLEFFLCLESGFESGIINYDKRAHDKLIESDRYIALATIERIKNFVATLDGSKRVKLEVGYDIQSHEFVTIETNGTRELVYNIEHAVHHMAIIKIGVRDVAPTIQLPGDFGVAASTIRYHQDATVVSAHNQ